MTSKKAASRERIISTAISLYLDGGLKQVTMRRIASALKLTPMALYRHFHNKEELLIALIDEGFRIFAEYQFRALQGATTAERLWLAGKAFVDFTLEQPEFFKVLFMAPDIFATTTLPEEVNARGRSTYQFLVDRVSEGLREGYLRGDEPEKLARTIWGLSHGLASLYLSQMLETDEAGFRQMFMEAFLHLGAGISVDTLHP